MTRRRDRRGSAPARASALALVVLLAVLLCSADVDGVAGWFQTTLDSALATEHAGGPRAFDVFAFYGAAILPAGGVLVALWQQHSMRLWDLPAASVRPVGGSVTLANTAVAIDCRTLRGP